MLYYTPSVGPDMAALKAAFKKCGELLQVKNLQETVILVPQKSNLDGIIRDLLGEDLTRILLKSNMCDLKGIIIHLFTKRNMPIHCKIPILAAYIDTKTMNDLIKKNPGVDILYVPWTEDELDSFKKTYQAEEISM